jgi:hypothetical protein
MARTPIGQILSPEMAAMIPTPRDTAAGLDSLAHKDGHLFNNLVSVDLLAMAVRVWGCAPLNPTPALDRRLGARYQPCLN